MESSGSSNSTRVSTPVEMRKELTVGEKVAHFKQRLAKIEDRKRRIDDRQDAIDHLANQALLKMDFLHTRYRVLSELEAANEDFL